MTKIKDLNKNERNMLIILCMLIIILLLNWSRVSKGVLEGFDKFFGSPVKVEAAK